MAGSVNKVILVGNLGRDPEVRSSQDGTKIVNLSIATSERWKDRNSGEQRERSQAEPGDHGFAPARAEGRSDRR